MLDPLRASRRIRDEYRRYLSSAFPLRREELRVQFEEQLDRSFALSKGPILEASAPYVTGPTVRELVEEGVLADGFLRLSPEAFDLDRPLYVHQERAIRKAVSGRRNLIVATGTGSGKTETFLLPIIDYLLREADHGTLHRPGVRALLLYPMNALANDQLKRLRVMLADLPEITFGRYVGETREDEREAEDDFARRYPFEPRLDNELLSRQRMQERPPHLLLTNYAMLEYLLLRRRTARCSTEPPASIGNFSHSTRSTSTAVQREPRSGCCCDASASGSWRAAGATCSASARAPPSVAAKPTTRTSSRSPKRCSTSRSSGPMTPRVKT